MPAGSLSVGDYPSPVVRLECSRCDRRGQYARDRLAARFGADAALPDVLVALASCERRGDFSKPCGARYADLKNNSEKSNGYDQFAP